MSMLSKAAKVAAFVVFAVCGLLGQSASAETLWIHPDRDPFRGSLSDALGLFAARGIPRQVLEEQQRLYVSGRCARRRIGDGERIVLMTFGRDRVLPNVIAEVSLWPDWAPRGATICLAAAQGGVYALVRPDVCGNWSEERLPPSAAPTPVAPAAVEMPDAGPGFRPEVAGVPGIAPGSGGFSSPAGFLVPAVFPDGFGPDGFGGDSRGPVGLVSPAVLPAGPAGDLPSPAGFVVPTVSPDIPEDGLAPGPLPPPLSGPPAPPDPPDPPPANVPEPASGALLGSALAALVLTRRVLQPRRAGSAAGVLSWRDIPHRHRVPPR